MLTIQNKAENRLEIAVPGDFDAEFAVVARSHFEEIADTWNGDVRLDFMQTHFLDSSGIGAIVFLYKRLSARNLGLDITNINGQPLEVLRSLRIDRVIPIQRYELKAVS